MKNFFRLPLKKNKSSYNLHLHKKRKIDFFPYTLLLPAIVALIVFILFPVISALRLSLYSSTFANEYSLFVGLLNYQKMFKSPEFWNAIKVTVIYTIFTVAGAYLLGLSTSLLLNKQFFGRKLARLLLIIPWAIPQVVVAMLWMLMYDYQFGVFNYFLTSWGVSKQAIIWLGSSSQFISLVAVTLPTIWQQYPVATIMLLAGRLMIPIELYEAADIDGANTVQKFRYITLPGLHSVTTVLILLFVIWSFKRFDIIYLLTQGGPFRATETLTLQTYLQAFQDWHMGYAATIGTFTLIISILFSTIYLKIVAFDVERS